MRHSRVNSETPDPTPAGRDPIPGSGEMGRLILSNRGNRHGQILAIILHSKTSKAEPVRMTRGFYLLAGGEAELPLPDRMADGLAAVEVETTGGRLSAMPTDPNRLKD